MADIQIGVLVDDKKATTSIKNIEKSAKKAKDNIGKSAGNPFKDLIEGSGVAKSKLGQLTSSFTSGKGSVLAWTGAITAAATAVLLYSKSIINNADNISKQSQMVGLSSDAYQRWGHALNLAGFNIEGMSRPLRRLQENIGDATKKGSDAQKAFQTLGVSVTNNNGTFRTQEEILRDTVLSLSKMEDKTKRNFIAMDIFGQQASKLNPLLNSGNEAIKKLIDSGDKHVVVSERMIIAAENIKDSWEEINNQLSKTLNSFLEPIIMEWSVFSKMLENSSAIDTVSGGLNSFGLIIQQLLKGIIHLAEGIIILHEALKLAGNGIFLIGAGLNNLVSKLPFVSSEYKKFSDELLNISFDGTKESLEKLTGAFNTMLDGFDGSKSKMSDLSGGLNNTTKDTDKQTKAMEALQSAFRTTFDAIDKEVKGTSFSGNLELLESEYDNILNSAHKASIKFTDEESKTLDTWYNYKLNKLVAANDEEKNATVNAENEKYQAQKDNLNEWTRFLVDNTMNGVEKQKAIIDLNHVDRINTQRGYLEKGLIDKETFNARELELNELHTAQLAEADKIAQEKRRNDLVNAAMTAVDTGLTIMDKLFQAQSDREDKRLADFEKRESEKIKSLNVTNKRKEQLEKELQKALDKQKKVQFEKDKRRQAAMALINGAVGVTMGYAQLGPIGGTIAAVATLAVTLAELAVINGQNYANGGIVKNTKGQGVDKETVNLTEGEMVLTKSNQRSLLTAIRGNSFGSGSGDITMGNIIIHGNTNDDTINQIRESQAMQSQQLLDSLNDLSAKGYLRESVLT